MLSIWKRTIGREGGGGVGVPTVAVGSAGGTLEQPKVTDVAVSVDDAEVPPVLGLPAHMRSGRRCGSRLVGRWRGASHVERGRLQPVGWAPRPAGCRHWRANSRLWCSFMAGR